MKFSIIKLAPIDLSSGQEVALPNVNPVSVYFDYNVNEIPRMKLTLSVVGEKLYKYKYYKCILEFNDKSRTNEFDFFVEHIDENSSSNTVLTGLMCNYEQATKYKSASLGNTISEAVGQLGFERKITSFDKSSVNFNYFQFNETANDALLKILIGNSPYSYGFITDKSIGTRDFRDLNKLDKSTFIEYTPNSTEVEIYVGNPYSVETDLSNNKVKFKSVVTNESPFNIYQASINGESIIYDETCPQELNAMYNRKFMGTLNKSFTVKRNNPIPLRPNIGDVVLVKEFKYFNTSNEGFPAVITRHRIYESSEVVSYIYRLETV